MKRTNRSGAAALAGIATIAWTTCAAMADAQMTEASFPPQGVGAIEQFGIAIDLDGTRGVAGGAGTPSGPQHGPGRAFVFERQQGTWSTVADLTQPGATPGFGRAVAIEGDVIVVGDGGAFPETPEIATAVGAVHVFTFDGNAWNLTQTLQSGVTGDGFGQSVAIHGDTIVVGAPEAPPGAAAAQPVRVYRLVSGIWTHVQDLVGFDSVPGDRFGAAVGVDDDLLVAGAPYDLPHFGAAYVFEEAAGSFGLTQKVTLGPLNPSSEFGTSLAVHGERFLVGAPEWNGTLGVALLYEKETFVGWSPVRVFQKSALFAKAGDRFGADVDLEDDRVAIGVPGEDPGGVVYVGTGQSESWPLHRILPVDGPFSGFGFSVALSGDRVAAGLPESVATALVQIAFVAHAGEPLEANTDSISVAAGGAQALELDLPSQDAAGDTFLLLGSLSGDAPGVPLPNGGTLPLNPDPYFFFSFANPTTGLLAPGTGTLDGAGNGASAVVVPAGLFPSAVGLTLHHAAVTFQPGTYDVTGATNAVPVTFVP